MRSKGSQIDFNPQYPKVTNPRIVLEDKIRNHGAAVGVVGLGYAGLSAAVEMAKAGFCVTGIDFDGARVNAVNAGISDHVDVPSETLFQFVVKNQIKATQSLATVEELDAISICVPTPLQKTNEPSLSYVVAAIETLRNHLRPGQLIVLESTAYPGAMRQLILPILEETGLQVGEDFFLAYTPQRLNPGDPSYKSHVIPRVISGITTYCTEMAVLFYRQFIETIIPVSSPETAEMVKLLENTFSSVNTAVVNEIALLSRKLGINVWEVIDAAQSKPFGFMPFHPGPGMGSDVAPVDARYISSKTGVGGFHLRMIELATDINSQMSSFIIERIADALNEAGKSLKHSRILALGVSHKRDSSGLCEAAAIEVLRGLRQKGVSISFADPYQKSIEIEGAAMKSIQLSSKIVESMDCIVLLNDHENFDYAMIAAQNALVIDSRNGFKSFPRPNIIPL